MEFITARNAVNKARKSDKAIHRENNIEKARQEGNIWKHYNSLSGKGLVEVPQAASLIWV